MTKKQDFVIIIDSREQRPYTFRSIGPDFPQTKTSGLKTGDYSLIGFENEICIERKTLADLFGSMGSGRKRFEKEIMRMSKMSYAGLVLESPLTNIFINPPPRSKMNPRAVFRSLISWSIKYNIAVWPAWNREAGEKITYLLLKNFFIGKRG